VNLVPLGILIKPHGLKGYVSCRLFNKESKALKKNTKVYFNKDLDSFLIIESIAHNSNNRLIKFTGIDDRSIIEKYKNFIFYIDRNDLPELYGNENYFVDFIGCELFNQYKKRVGMVKDIIHIKNNDILVFDSHQGEKMLPFAKDLILFFDKDDKKLVMDIHEGIFG